MQEVYVLKINRKLTKQEFNKLLTFISPTKKVAILELNTYIKAQESLLGEVMARVIICDMLKIKNDTLLFSTNKFGKPVIRNHPQSHFNISHSNNWIACILAKHPVGIDVETIQPINLRVVKKILSMSEYESFLSQPKKYQLKYFYTLWTIKESYVKAIGKGLSIPLNSFDIKDNKIIHIDTNKDKITPHFYQTILLDDNTVCSVCQPNAKSILKFYLLDIKHIRNFKKGTNQRLIVNPLY